MEMRRYFLTGLLPSAPLESDATDSTRMAVNFARHGVMSLDSADPYQPTGFRELRLRALCLFAAARSDSGPSPLNIRDAAAADLRAGSPQIPIE